MKTLFLAPNQRDATNIEVITKGITTTVVWAVLYEDFISDGAHESVEHALENRDDTELVECVLLTKAAWDACRPESEVTP